MEEIEERYKDYDGNPIKSGFYRSMKNPAFLCFIERSSLRLVVSYPSKENSIVLFEKYLHAPVYDFFIEGKTPEEYTKLLVRDSNPLGLAQRLKDEAQWIESNVKMLNLQKQLEVALSQRA